jgi:hypothetical protein
MDRSDRYLAWKERGGHAKFVSTIAMAVMLPAGMFASGRHSPVPLLFLVPIGALIGYVISSAISIVTIEGAAHVARSFTMPATTGHYANEHSEIMTLEARGDFKGAVAAWEAVAVAEPANPWPLVRSAELYAEKLGDPATAIERFRLARTLPDIKPELTRYVSQKIVGLLLGPLDDKGRAMVELRMLIDRYPTSREADGARDALRNLKAPGKGGTL